jgi:hypothetical protein
LGAFTLAADKVAGCVFNAVYAAGNSQKRHFQKWEFRAHGRALARMLET